MSIKEDDVSCAETDGATLFFSRGFMGGLESSAGADGVHFVVAHELGHQVVGMEVGGHAGEFAADEFAARALARAGGEFRAIASVFSFLPESDGSTHPSNSARLARARAAFMDAREEHASIAVAKVGADRTHERDFAL